MRPQLGHGPGTGTRAADVLRRIRLTAWIMLALAPVALGVVLIVMRQESRGLGPLPSSGFVVAQPFRLTTHTGQPFTDTDFRAKPHLVFFGFTNCPDVCPTTLYELSQEMAALGPAADNLGVLFVAVDVERDTREQVALYLQSFDPRIIGLTGSQQEIDAAVVAFRAYYKKIPDPNGSGGYTVAHTTLVYLFKPGGQFAGTLDPHEALGAKRQKLERLARST